MKTFFLLVSLLFYSIIWAQDYPSFFILIKENNRIQDIPEGVHRMGTLRLNSSLKAKKMPRHIELQLFSDKVIRIDLDEVEAVDYKNLHVYRGKTLQSGFDHLSHYRDVVAIHNPKSDKWVFQISGHQGNFQITPDQTAGVYQVLDLATEEIFCKTVPMEEDFSDPKRLKANYCNEQDATGRHIADLFVGYSYEAAALVGDIDAHALSLVEEVNNGLINSLVDNIRIRLVGTGLNPENPGILGKVLGDLSTWYSEDIARTGADYIASIQIPTGATGEAGGWAGVGGRTSVNSYYGAAAVFRHELGHNIGSSHCYTPTGGSTPYSFGHNNGTVKTHMCGNTHNFYSTPLVVDENSVPIGVVDQADNARLWRERAFRAATHQRHTIRFDESDTGRCPTDLVTGTYYIQNINSGLYLSTTGTNAGAFLKQSNQLNDTSTWEIIKESDNTYRIIQSVSNRAVDVPGSTLEINRKMIIWTNQFSANQLFTIDEIGQDSFTIRCFNGFCLQINNQGIAVGDTIVQRICEVDPNSYWRFVPVIATSPILVEVEATHVSCAGDSTGTATAIVSGTTGTVTYTWSNGTTGSMITDLAAGRYTLTVTDDTQSSTFNFSIYDYQPMDLRVTPVAGGMTSLGGATATIMNGNGTYSYEWSNGETGSTANMLTPGIHSVTVTETGGCTVVKEFYVPCTERNDPCRDQNLVTIGEHIDINCDCQTSPISCAPGIYSYNVAKGKATNQSSTNGGGSADKLVDGNTSGIYSDGSVNQTNSEKDPWWEVDLGEVVPIDDIVLWARTDCCWGRMKNIHIFISTTPFTSTDLDVNLADNGLSHIAVLDAEGILPVKAVTAGGVMGRYVRIQMDEDDRRFNLAEVEIYSCGYIGAEITAINPLSYPNWEIKAQIQPSGRTIDSMYIEYGLGAFTHRMQVPVGAGEEFLLSQNLVQLAAATHQLRIAVYANGQVYYSNPETIYPDQLYCTPTAGNDLWYKRFRHVQYNGFNYIDGGNFNYEDTTEITLAEFEMGTNYTITLGTPDAGWYNLNYYIYIDLNNDGDFDDYNELVGLAPPVSQFTEVVLTIPTEDLLVNADLRMRILGNEAGVFDPCYTGIGNIKDFTVRILEGLCQGSGYLVERYLDADGDGFGDKNHPVIVNCMDMNAVDDSTDFNDASAAAYPGAIEICDQIDNDGDSLIDEAADLGPAILSFSNESIASGIYTAATQIMASSQTQISSLEQVDWYTGDHVNIDPIFSIDQGAIFTIQILKNCGN